MLRRLFRPDKSDKQFTPAAPGSLIVGLGNPGTKYANTRHNVGFMVIDKLGSRFDARSKERFQGAILEAKHGDETLVLLKPLTFMNNSGQSVSEVTRWYKIPPERVLIVYDDLDLPFGTIRLRPKGSDGGHNGLASVIQHIKTDEIPRLRIGIGRPTSGSTVNYVLSRFSKHEQEHLDEIIDASVEAAWSWLHDGIERTMNTVNRKEVLQTGALPDRTPAQDVS